MKRRDFLKTGAAVAAASVLNGGAISEAMGAQIPDMAIVQGEDYFHTSLKAVELLGGMHRFLPQGGVIGILPNASFRNPGTYTSPEVVLAVIQMCYEAGVKEICYLGRESRHLSRSSHFEELSDAMNLVKPPARSGYVTRDIPQGKAASEVELREAFVACDAFINIPVVKQHQGTDFSCSMKNLMGITSRGTNQFFHYGSENTSGWYGNIEFLSQCIADLNLVRKPALILVDATECISSNGPFGPGELIRPQKVIAATDPVLVDAYACTLLGHQARDIVMITQAAEHGIGSMNLESATIQELVLS